MKKFLLVFFCTVLFARAAGPLTATITDQVSLELMKGKGSIGLKKGAVVTVVSKDGDMLEVVYRNVQGRVPLNKTDFKGEVPKDAAPKPETKPAIVVNSPASPAPVAKPAETKPATVSSPLKTDAPQSMAGKMVKKAADNAAKHNENLVNPVDETVGGKK